MEKIAIYGTGTIGSCLATLMICHNLPCTLVGHSDSGLERAKKSISTDLDDLIHANIITLENKKAALNLLRVTNNVQDFKDATFVFEVVSENLDIKKSAYESIAKHAAENVIIASGTSSFDASVLANLTKDPDRFVIAHPFQPAHLQPLVEIVRHESTSDETMQRTLTLLQKLHRQIVILNRSIPGFVVNRIAMAIYREAASLVEQGIASPEDIDRAIQYGIGKRYGSIGFLEYIDSNSVMPIVANNLFPTLNNDTRISEKLAKGKVFFDWDKKDLEDFRNRKNTPFMNDAKNWNFPI